MLLALASEFAKRISEIATKVDRHEDKVAEKAKVHLVDMHASKGVSGGWDMPFPRECHVPPHAHVSPREWCRNVYGVHAQRAIWVQIFTF